MKQCRKCVALAISALMLSTLVSTNFKTTYATGLENTQDEISEEQLLNNIEMGIIGESEEDDVIEDEQIESDSVNLEDEEFIDDSDLEIVTDDIEDINSSSLSAVNTTTSTVTLHWFDDNYANSSYTITAVSVDSLQPNTASPHVKTVTVSGTNTTTISDLKSGMQYTIYLVKQGSVYATTTVKTRPEFLIIVGESLYSGIKSSLDIYNSDLRYKEDMGAEIMRVSKTSTASGVTKVTTPAQMKNQILTKFASGRGIKGFVIIGSGDDIPTAKVESVVEGDNEKWVSDLYYADVFGTWTDADNDGFFDDANDVKYTPELYYGRINPKGLVTSTADQVSYINNYLSRVHNYRTNGSNLSNDIKNKGFIFNDSDFANFYTPAGGYSNLVKDITTVPDRNNTNIDSLVSALNSGNCLVSLAIHSSNNLHQIHTLNPDNNKDEYANWSLSYLRSHLNSGAPIFNFMNLYCCSACKFENANGQAIENLGAYYLFNSNTGLNVTGSTGTFGPWLKDDFYKRLGERTSVGSSYISFLNNENTTSTTKQSKAVLLGDPTLKYNFNIPSNKSPYITTNLSGSLSIANGTASYATVNAGSPFYIYASDSDSSTVDMNISGISSSCVTASGSKGKKITINTPGTYYIRVKACNKDASGNAINGHSAAFHLVVK